MYNELLKQHEEILKKLTDKASKETDFGERGQFINIQKMVEMEIRFIKNLNEIIEEYSDKENESNQTKQVEKESKPNKYVYAFEGNEGCMDLIYFDDFDGKDIINISNVRHTSKLVEVKEALFLANSMGYKLIIDCSAFGRHAIESIKLIDDSIDIIEVRCTNELNSNAWSTYSKIKNSIRLQSNDDLASVALEAFDEINIDLSKGYVKWSLDRSDGRESLLRAILIAYHTIVELNK